MKEMKTLTIGENQYEIVDAAAREQIDKLGDNVLLVTVDGGTPSHTPYEIKTHVQNGGRVVLFKSGQYIPLTYADADMTTFESYNPFTRDKSTYVIYTNTSPYELCFESWSQTIAGTDYVDQVGRPSTTDGGVLLGGILLNDIETNQAGAFAAAFGSETKALGQGSIAGGVKKDASGDYPTDENGNEIIPDEAWRYNEAHGTGSMAMGMGAVAFSRASKSLGYRTQTGRPVDEAAAGDRAEAKNYGYAAENAGQAAVAIGSDTVAYGNNSLAGGYKSLASNAQAIALGTNVEAAGVQSIALGSEHNYKDSDGRSRTDKTLAAGHQHIAIGWGAQTKEFDSEGKKNERSMAIGFRTVAATGGQIVIGKLNKQDENAAFIIANGSSDDPDGDGESRHNSFVLDKQNNLKIDAGTINLHSQNSDTLVHSDISITMRAHYNADIEADTGAVSIVGKEGVNLCSSGRLSLEAPNEEIAAVTKRVSVSDNATAVAAGLNSIAIGRGNTGVSANEQGAQGPYSIAIGNENYAKESYSVAIGNKTQALASTAVALGGNTIAEGQCSFAMGSGAKVQIERDENNNDKNKVGCNNAVAMGEGSVAHARASAAFGYQCKTRGLGAFSIGANNESNGYASATFGRNNIANRDYQMVIGQHNETSDTAMFIVANGTYNQKNNLFVVESDGEVIADGDIYAHGTHLVATCDYVDSKVAAMVDSAPETLNTLNELATALGDDPNFATTVANHIGQLEKEISDDKARIATLENELAALRQYIDEQLLGGSW